MSGVVYWEEQEARTMTCGRHSLNNLLQGPYFNDVDLAEIANRLDEKEKSLSDKDQNIPIKNSHNVSDTGDYSIQVLAEALWTKGFEDPRIVDEVYMLIDDINKETAFLCHSMAHWLAIRRVSGIWFWFNSLESGPYRFTDLSFKYLKGESNSTYIRELIKEKSLVYVIKGGNFEEPVNDV